MNDKYIHIDCYQGMCDTIFDTSKDTWNSYASVIFCSPENIPLLFTKIKNIFSKKCIIVTAGSDYGIHHQAESHPNKDLHKAYYGIDFHTIAKHQEYCPVWLRTAAYENCNASHKYSVKIDRYTIGTFNEIPKNVVRWYCANLNIPTDERVKFLPYGLNLDTEKNGIDGFYKEKKERSVYINFQEANCYRRMELKPWFRELSPKCGWTFRESPNIPVREYYQEMADHKYIIAPDGNGMDSYRIYESFVLGSIPVVEMSYWSLNLDNAGFHHIQLADYRSMYQYPGILGRFEHKFDRKLLTQEYWRNKINEARKLLG